MSNDIIPETKRIKRSPIEVAFEVLAEADMNKEQEEAYIIIRELLQPSHRVKHAMHPSEISIEDLNSIATVEVPVAAGRFEKSVPDGFDEITNEKELQRVAAGEVDEAIEYMGECAKVIMEQESADIFKEEAKHIRTLIRAAQQQIPDRNGQLSLCASGLISLLYQEPDDVKQIREYIVPELRSCLATAAQQPRQECPHNCPHCYAIEVRNNLPSPPKETR